MYREIVTKAVVGKGKISNTGEIVLNPINQVSKGLGCWIINHYYVSSYECQKVYAKGRYDVHVWYGYNNDSDTTIHAQTIDYVEEFNINLKSSEGISETNEFIIKCIKYPTCSSLCINDDGTISVKVDKELNLDVIGEAKLRVQISSSSEDEWINSDEINDINVNYLSK